MIRRNLFENGAHPDRMALLSSFNPDIRKTIVGVIAGAGVGLAAGLLGTNELTQRYTTLAEMYPYVMTAGGLAGTFAGAYIGPFVAHRRAFYDMLRK